MLAGGAASHVQVQQSFDEERRKHHAREEPGGGGERHRASATHLCGPRGEGADGPGDVERDVEDIRQEAARV